MINKARISTYRRSSRQQKITDEKMTYRYRDWATSSKVRRYVAQNPLGFVVREGKLAKRG